MQSQLHELDVLRAQIREAYGRVAYSHKTQEKSADYFFRAAGRMKWLQIILSAITTAGVIITVFDDPARFRTMAVLSALCSCGLLIVTVYSKEGNPEGRANLHKATANRLWLIRESYVSLVTDIVAGTLTVAQATDRRDKLQEELGQIYSQAPNAASGSYKAASKGLQRNEELTFTDEEIDLMLPAALREAKKEKGSAG
jgi:hypothetical protein